MKKRVLFVAIILLLIFIGLRRHSAPFFSLKDYQCLRSDLLSDDYFFSFNKNLAALLNDNVVADVLIARLIEQFSAVKKIIVSYRPSTNRIMIYAHEPICCINNAFILTSNNEIFPKNVFSVSAISEIPHVAVSQESMSNAALFVSSLLKELPTNIDSLYKLELVNEHCVHFVDNEQPNFTIVSSVAQKKSSMLLSQCELVKQTIDARKGFDKDAKWIADTRFAHYIVAYKA